MRIPDAYFDGGFGQRIPQLKAGPAPDPSGAEMIGQAGRNLGNAVMGIATDALEEQGRREYQAAYERKQEQERLEREQEQELKRLERAKRDGEARMSLFAHANTLEEITATLLQDQKLSPQEKRDQFEQLAGNTRSSFMEAVPEEYQYAFGASFEEHRAQALKLLNGGIAKDLQSSIRAAGMAAREELLNSSKPLAAKLAIIRDPLAFDWEGEGYSDPERETLIQGFIERASVADIEARFNRITDLGAKGIQALKDFRAALSAKGEGDHYQQYPELDPTKRQAYVNMARTKIDHLESQAREEANRRRNEARQTAQELLNEFKGKVERGWMPTSTQDYKFVEQVRQYSRYSPSLARQFGDIHGNMTSFEYRQKLRTKDPLGVAAAERGVMIPSLDLLDPSTLPQQMAQRVAIAQKLGVKAAFLGPEIEAYTERLKALAPRDQVKELVALGKIFGPMTPASFNAASEQVRQQAPQTSMLFRLVANGRITQARQYAAGLDLIHGEKKDLIKDKLTRVTNDIGREIDQRLGTALQAVPGTRNDLKDAVAVAYLGAAQERGLPVGSVDKGLLAQVAAGVIGRTTKTGSASWAPWGAYKTTIVPDGMTEDQFLNTIKLTTAKDVERMGGINGMSHEEAAEFIKSAPLHEVAGGYTVYREGKAVYTTKGKPFVFRPAMVEGPKQQSPVQAPPQPRTQGTAQTAVAPPAKPAPGPSFFEEVAAESRLMQSDAARGKYGRMKDSDYVTAVDGKGRTVRAPKKNTWMDDDGVIRLH